MNAKALLFDLYGIFMREQDAAGKAHIEEAAGLAELGVASADFWAGYKRHRDALDAGQLTHPEYFAHIAADLGVEFPHGLQAVADADFASYENLNAPAIEWLREMVAANYQPALLSNLILPLKIELLSRYDWLDLFEPRIFSCDVDLTKPDPAIYQLAWDRINERRAAHGEPALAAQDVLFIDDRQVNLDGATAVGMSTYLFADLADAKRTVKEFMSELSSEAK